MRMGTPAQYQKWKAQIKIKYPHLSDGEIFARWKKLHDMLRPTPKQLNK